jgi:hypothetical protein
VAEILRRTPGELRYDLKLRALTGLVERGLFSSGLAAELVGVSRREFLDWCSRGTSGCIAGTTATSTTT